MRYDRHPRILVEKCAGLCGVRRGGIIADGPEPQSRKSPTLLTAHIPVHESRSHVAPVAQRLIAWLHHSLNPSPPGRDREHRTFAAHVTSWTFLNLALELFNTLILVPNGGMI
jgi:hypothetical protein